MICPIPVFALGMFHVPYLVIQRHALCPEPQIGMPAHQLRLLGKRCNGSAFLLAQAGSQADCADDVTVMRYHSLHGISPVGALSAATGIEDGAPTAKRRTQKPVVMPAQMTHRLGYTTPDPRDRNLHLRVFAETAHMDFRGPITNHFAKASMAIIPAKVGSDDVTALKHGELCRHRRAGFAR